MGLKTENNPPQQGAESGKLQGKLEVTWNLPRQAICKLASLKQYDSTVFQLTELHSFTDHWAFFTRSQLAGYGSTCLSSCVSRD